MVEITNKEYKQLTEYIKANYGINLTEKKQTLLVGRLNKILMQKKIANFSDYYDYVTSDKTGDAVIFIFGFGTLAIFTYLKEIQAR